MRSGQWRLISLAVFEVWGLKKYSQFAKKLSEPWRLKSFQKFVVKQGKTQFHIYPSIQRQIFRFFSWKHCSTSIKVVLHQKAILGKMDPFIFSKIEALLSPLLSHDFRKLSETTIILERFIVRSFTMVVDIYVKTMWEVNTYFLF